MIRENLIAILFLTMLALYGCGGDNNVGIGGETVVTVLDGNWKTSCIVIDPTSASSPYEIVTLMYLDNTYTVTIKYYNDSNCLSLFASNTARGEYGVGKGTTTNNGGAATEVDVNIIEIDGVAVNNLLYSIFHITKDLAGDTLLQGDETAAKNGTTPELRFDTLNQIRVYTLQK